MPLTEPKIKEDKPEYFHLSPPKNWQGLEELRIKITCPNCGRVIRVLEHRPWLPKKLKLKCKKCPLEAFDWEYSIMRTDPEANRYPRYSFITIKACVPLYRMDKVRKFNEKNTTLTNK